MRKLEELVESYNFESVSDVIRKAIEEFIEKNSKKTTRGPGIKVTRNILENLNKGLTDDAGITIEDLVRAVLREYTANIMNREIEKLTKGEPNHGETEDGE
ncbi:MAG: ribbon-helix-helix domain-containing protein [Candidatus Thermoplasmatota archaeon]|jgi:CopG family nickel-responsive transcriptional regulator|nr:ribbon-helix-helix domain-containing protein [Candidatus Thermoplasmatota archaeon]MCL5793724.1 ribbon-helix-helix domain-containing protein [Candidatus Thermoplasmatota archaeon]